MVDAERLARLLRRVTDDLARLRQHADAPEHVLADEIVLDRVKYRFVTAIEGCIDAAQHVCAAEGFQTPATNADAMRELARHGWLPDDLAEDLARAVGFRNVLVHRYTEVDDRAVIDHLRQLDRLDAFVTTLQELL